MLEREDVNKDSLRMEVQLQEYLLSFTIKSIKNLYVMPRKPHPNLHRSVSHLQFYRSVEWSTLLIVLCFSRH